MTSGVGDDLLSTAESRHDFHRRGFEWCKAGCRVVHRPLETRANRCHPNIERLIAAKRRRHDFVEIARVCCTHRELTQCQLLQPILTQAVADRRASGIGSCRDLDADPGQARGKFSTPLAYLAE